jgi:hypothetical protein
MVAAREYNQKTGEQVGVVYGAVTTGNVWKFLRLDDAKATIDIHEYYIVDLARIMGIFVHIIQSA